MILSPLNSQESTVTSAPPIRLAVAVGSLTLRNVTRGIFAERYAPALHLIATVRDDSVTSALIPDQASVWPSRQLAAPLEKH